MLSHHSRIPAVALAVILRAAKHFAQPCRELLSGVEILPVRHTLRILAIVERILDVCAVAKRLDRRPTAPAQSDNPRHGERLAEPVGDGCCIRDDGRTVLLRPDSLSRPYLDLAKALDSRSNDRRVIRHG